jgi:prepilin-type N-terminal cleavage/methylation domain-containing protein
MDPANFAVRKRTPGAFTLVELLVVIAIIGILVALLLPAIQAAREASRRADCSNQIRQLAIATHNYESSTKKLPGHGDVYLNMAGNVAGGLSAQARVLPYMEQQALADLVHQDLHWRASENTLARTTPLGFLRCPSNGRQIEPSFSLVTSGGSTIERSIHLRCHYVGNMGARPGPNRSNCPGTTPAAPYCSNTTTTGGRGGPTSSGLVFPETTYCQYSCTDRAGGSGGTAVNGVIYPLSKIGMGQITDGTSHTMMWGELSWDCGTQGAWIIGSSSQDGTNWESSSHGWVYNAKVIRWGLNERKSGEPDEQPDIAGVQYVPQTEESLGSMHPSGAHIAMSDGAVGFVSNEIDVAILRAMASRKSEDLYDKPF